MKLGKRKRVRPTGARLAKLREQQGLSQGDLARAVGCSQAQLSRIEDGVRSPGLALAFAIEDQGLMPARAWLSK